jgi:hypothetical protein
VPTKGTKVIPPANNKKRDEKGEKVNFSTEEVVFKIEEDEEIFLASVGSNEIDLIIDTAAETSTLDPRSKDILVNVREEDMILNGIGGSIKSKEVGQSIFGKTRVFKIKDNKALISYPCACSKWSISSPERGSIVLKEWPGEEFTGLEFLFKQDKKKYGDTLFHHTLKRSDFPKFAAFAGEVGEETVYSFYFPKEPVNLKELSSSELESNNRVNDVHIRYNHISGPGLE